MFCNWLLGSVIRGCASRRVLSPSQSPDRGGAAHASGVGLPSPPKSAHSLPRFCPGAQSGFQMLPWSWWCAQNQIGATIGLATHSRRQPLQVMVCRTILMLRPQGEPLKQKTMYSPDGTNENGMTRLHVAARDGDLEAVRCLIGPDADLNVRDKNGLTSLQTARQMNNTSAEYVISQWHE